MADQPQQHSRKSRSRPLVRRRRQRSGNQVQVWVQSRPRRRWLWRWLSLVVTGIVLWCGLSLLVLSLRWGFQLMLDPYSLPWLQTYLGETGQQGEGVPLTPAEIAEAVKAQGGQLGEPLTVDLDTNGISLTYQVFPVLAKGVIRELRLYRPAPGEATPQRLTLLTALAITDVPEASVLTPLMGTSQATAPGSRSLPLASLDLLQTEADGTGAWLSLSDRWRQGNVSLRYGQLVYLSSNTPYLESSLVWSSPHGRSPEWLDLDSSDPLDILVDGSVGLEPAFSGYRLLRQDGLGPNRRSVEVSLQTVPLEAASLEATYRQALTLARSGLWSDALRQLNILQERLSDRWTPAAEAQRRLIQRHAQITQQQADRTWSIPTQQILASLVDGRWQQALEQLDQSASSQTALFQLLADDDGRFWNRVQAALQLHPGKPEVMVWGGLILQAEDTPEAALAWLERQQATPATLDRFTAIARQPDPVPAAATSNSATVTVAADSAPPTPTIQAILGRVTALASSPNLEDWYTPEAPPRKTIPAGASWYRIPLVASQKGEGWTTTFTWESSQAAWKALAPTWRSPLQMTSRQSTPVYPIPLTVQGLRLERGSPVILATGEAIAAPMALAYSSGSLVWLTPGQGLTVRDTSPVREALLATLAQAPTPKAPPTEVTPLIDDATYYSLDITGDGSPEQIVVFEPSSLERLPSLNISCGGHQSADSACTAPAKTLILGTDGHLLYSDLFKASSLMAVTSASAPALLVNLESGQYRFQLWPME